MSEDSVNEQGDPMSEPTSEIPAVPSGDHVYATAPSEPAPSAPAPTQPRTSRKLLAGMAVVALLCGAAGAAAGLAIGHNSGGGAQELNSATGGSGGQGTFSWPQNGNGSGGYGGFGGLPGNGYSGGGGNGYGGYGNGYETLQGSGLATATAAQLTGLVRVSSTLTDGLAAGTGMILTSNGEVVTNNHVVDGSVKLRVKVMSTGKSYTAKVVGTDPTDDIAVLQLVDASGLTPVTIDHDPLTVGAKVTAIGDAGGTTEHLSSSPGTVSALSRSITTTSELGGASGEHLTGLIEIAADVISGDSGGAVVDSQGEVTGMTTAAGGGGSSPTGYAIPIAKVIRVAGQIESGQASTKIHLGYPAFLGVELSPQGDGTSILGVIGGSPAAKAGLSAGDTIVSVNGTKVSTSSQLRAAIVAKQIGDSVKVTWRDRAGRSHSAVVTLVQGPAD